VLLALLPALAVSVSIFELETLHPRIAFPFAWAADLSHLFAWLFLRDRLRASVLAPFDTQPRTLIADLILGGTVEAIKIGLTGLLAGSLVADQFARTTRAVFGAGVPFLAFLLALSFEADLIGFAIKGGLTLLFASFTITRRPDQTCGEHKQGHST